MSGSSWIGAALRAVYLEINNYDERLGPDAAERRRLRAAAEWLRAAQRAARAGGGAVALTAAEARAVTLAADNMAKDPDALDAYFPGRQREPLFRGLTKIENVNRTKQPG